MGSCLEELGIVPDVEDTNKEFVTELELDAGKEDASTIVAVSCKARLAEELPGTEVELDRVVVASTAFGTGESLSVRASAPQAMYS